MGSVSSSNRGRFRLAPLALFCGIALAGCGTAYDTTGVAATKAPHAGTDASRPLIAAIERAGTRLCNLNTIDPNEQGGLAVIDVFSIGATASCDHAGTPGRGVLYVLDYPWSDDATTFFSLAEDNSRFLAGWIAGKVVIALGAGTSPDTQRMVAHALDGKADQVFPSS
jgi:hypothetical protein